MEDLQKDILHLQEEKTREQIELEKRTEEKKVIDRIIRGQNDLFVKHYKMEEFGVEFTIKIQAPNAIEFGNITARMSGYLSGMNNYVSQYMTMVYQTLGLIRVCGKEVPEFLQKDEEIYNLDILYTIGVDFAEWMNTFRR